MSINIIIALIALSGVVLSAIVSYFVSRRQTAVQLQNFVHKYSETLFKKRIETYPELYYHMSTFAKTAQDRQLTKDIVNHTLSKINEWDSKNILLVGHSTVLLIVKFERKLKKWSELQLEALNDEMTMKEAVEMVINLERILKMEIGVYSLTDFQRSALGTDT